jgi:hypothetical protein
MVIRYSENHLNDHQIQSTEDNREHYLTMLAKFCALLTTYLHNISIEITYLVIPLLL